MEIETSSVLEKIKQNRRRKAENALNECRKHLEEVDEDNKKNEGLLLALVNQFVNYSPDHLHYWLLWPNMWPHTSDN